MTVEPPLGPTDVASLASAVGLSFEGPEAQVFERHLERVRHSLARFLDDAPVVAPPAGFDAKPRRWWAPGEGDDPHRAWMLRCRIEGAVAGPLAGLSASFKDHVAVRDLPVRFGSATISEVVPRFDASVVTRVLAAGGTIVGKNVMDGLGGGGSPDFLDFPRPVNPLAPDRVAGGSSSGSAVAVAAGEVDVSIGGDQGGSIRVPAAYCGVFGLKPTFGLVSHFGAAFSSDQSVDHVGPIARSALDCARALEAVAGRDPLDPRQDDRVPPRVDVVAEASRDDLSGLRVGVLSNAFDSADGVTRDAILAAVDLLAAAGARVAEVRVDEHSLAAATLGPIFNDGALSLMRTGFFGVFAQTYYPPELISGVERLWQRERDSLSPRVKLRLLAAELARREFAGAAYATAQNLRPVLCAAYDRAFSDVDVLVMPTVPGPPPLVPAPVDRLEALEGALRGVTAPLTGNVTPFNVTGHPALAVPVPSSGPLPASMQVVGRRFKDAVVLRVGHAMQVAAG